MQSRILKKNINFSNVFPKKKFDVIICSEVLEHLEDPTIILKKLNKSLYTDGILLGSVPNGYGLTEIEKFLIHKLGIYAFIKGFIIYLKKTKEPKKKFHLIMSLDIFNFLELKF